MARSDKRFSIYPAARAINVLGDSSPALNQAIECWAAAIVRGTADNAKKIWNEESSQLNIRALKAWCLLADVLKGKQFDPDYANPGDLLATAVEDAHRLEGAGDKWFDSAVDEESYGSELDKKISAFVKTLRELDYVHAWAAIIAVQWYWDHENCNIDFKKDQWWTLAFRRNWKDAEPSQQQNIAKKTTRKKA